MRASAESEAVSSTGQSWARTFRNCRRSRSLTSAPRYRCAGFRVAACASRRLGRTAATAGLCRPRGGGRERDAGEGRERRGDDVQAPVVKAGEQPTFAGGPRVRDVAFVPGGRLYLARASSVTAGASCFCVIASIRRGKLSSACGRDRQSYRDCPVGDNAGAIWEQVERCSHPIRSRGRVIRDRAMARTSRE